jgi:hypothetical protein
LSPDRWNIHDAYDDPYREDRPGKHEDQLLDEVDLTEEGLDIIPRFL